MIRYSKIRIALPAAMSENKPLLDASVVGAAAVSGAGIVNATSSKIKKARADGPLTFRMLGFLGGIAMIISNGIAILERFFSFHFANCLIAIYGVCFGILIVLMDAPIPLGRKIQEGIRYYFKFLEFTLGRGVFFFFVGTLQIANWNMLDWAGEFEIACDAIFSFLRSAFSWWLHDIRWSRRDWSWVRHCSTNEVVTLFHV